ncbi:MAG: hypothetical protein GXY52_03965 [Chloroflexi bacterium]|nr:hypothetical protein [Chloroflexota bacterium]
MKKRWLVYALAGFFFGIFDFYYQILVQKHLPAIGLLGYIKVLLILGVFIIPLVPAVRYESKTSGSRLQAGLAGSLIWLAAIVAYYLTNAVQLAFIGFAGMPELHISQRAEPYFWENWKNVFTYSILGGMAEWGAIALVGGFIVGYLLSLILLRRRGSVSQ